MNTSKDPALRHRDLVQCLMFLHSYPSGRSTHRPPFTQGSLTHHTRVSHVFPVNSSGQEQAKSLNVTEHSPPLRHGSVCRSNIKHTAQTSEHQKGPVWFSPPMRNRHFWWGAEASQTVGLKGCHRTSPLLQTGWDSAVHLDQ